MKAAGYIRVSSEMQFKQGHSLTMQRQLITDYVHSKGWQLDEVFCESARSGRLTNRPALRMLLERTRHGEFDVIVVASLDRFYRSLKGLLLTLDQLDQWNVAFVSITENIDFTSIWGKVVLAVLGSLAEIYCDRLSAETKRGKQGRVLKGLWNGSIPFGYCNGLCSACSDVNGLNYCPQYGHPNRGDGKTLVVHPIEGIGVRLSFDWYETRQYSDGIIAEKLNCYVVTLPDGTTRHLRTKRLLSRGGPQPFTRDSVREMLMRVFYTGRVPYFGTTAFGTKLKRHQHSLLRRGTPPALVSIEVFDRCQEIRRQLAHPARRVAFNQRASFPLTGILFCGECGGHMIGARCKGERRSDLTWPNDWREQWSQVLESGWDQLPFSSGKVQENIGQEESVEAEGISLQTFDQVARQRSYDIERLIERMEPLSAFRAHWEIATSTRNYKAQKQLLQTAFTRIVVRGQAIEKSEATSAFAHLLRNTPVVCNANPGKEEPPLLVRIL